MDQDRRAWTMTFEELPAYETWTIECQTNQHARNLVLSIDDVNIPRVDQPSTKEDSGRNKPHVPNLSHSQITLLGDQTSSFEGYRTTAEGKWAILAVIIAVGGYCSAFYAFIYRYYGINWLDWIAPVAIVLFGVVLWWFTRRPAPSITQGFWTPSRDIPNLYE